MDQVVEKKPSVKFRPMQSREVATRVSILNPESQEQVQAIITAPDGGIIATIEKETLEAFAHFKHFSSAGKLHVWVETLPANEASNKAYKHKHEYRTVVPGMEVQQVKDLLSKFPEMARKLERAISKAPRVRFGFAFWVNVGNLAPVSMVPGLTLDESTGDIVKGLINAPTSEETN